MQGQNNMQKGKQERPGGQEGLNAENSHAIQRGHKT